MTRKPKKLTVDKALAEQLSDASRARRVRAPLVEIMHPNWSPFEDHRIMALKKAGNHFSAISRKIGRTTIAVEQRWQRLRVVSNVMDKLEAFGLSDTPYKLGAM